MSSSLQDPGQEKTALGILIIVIVDGRHKRSHEPTVKVSFWTWLQEVTGITSTIISLAMPSHMATLDLFKMEM